MSDHFPTPWKIDPHSFSVYAADVPKGSPRVADMRGWGYLTGKGHGALGLSDDEGIAAQKANAELIVKAVNNHDLFVEVLKKIGAVSQKDSLTEAERLADIRSVVIAMLSRVGGVAK